MCTSVCIPLGRVSIPLQRQLCAITSIAGEELEKDRAHTTGAMRGVYEPVCCYISQTKEIQTRGYTSLSIWFYFPLSSSSLLTHVQIKKFFLLLLVVVVVWFPFSEVFCSYSSHWCRCLNASKQLFDSPVKSLTSFDDSNALRLIETVHDPLLTHFYSWCTQFVLDC